MDNVRRTVADAMAELRVLVGRQKLPPPPPVDGPPIERVIVTQSAPGMPRTLEEAQAGLIEARLMGTRNLFALAEKKTALEALVTELRK